MSLIRYLGSNWNTTATNYDKVRPPNPSVIATNTNTSLSFQTLGSGSGSDLEAEEPKIGIIIYIKSREPYAVETLITKYGNIESKVGTNMGR